MARRLVSSFFALFILLSIVAYHLAEACTVPAMFVFGDSLLDVGTNNFLDESLAKVNHPYYGIDYPGSVPTGRFSNGHNCADRIAFLAGFKKMSPQPYFYLINHSSSFNQSILRHGVNFASGGSGILHDTGSRLFKKVVPLSEQIQQFSTIRGNLTQLLGPKAAAEMLNKSLFLISAGGNDLFDYQFHVSNYSNLPGKQLLGILLSTYQIHLQNLYNLGARKFGILSIPPLGCCPMERALTSNGDCQKDINDLAQAFFNSTEILLQNLSSNAQGMKYSLGNTYDIAYDIIDNPQIAGLKEVKAACCGNGSFNGPCSPGAKLCPYRTDYLFWDAVHPTQAACKLVARALFRGNASYVRPINFTRLVAD